MFFSFYQNCDFSGCKGSKSAKNGLKSEKILSVILHISGTHTSYDFHLCIYGTNDNISRSFFFHFIKILILRVFRERGGSKGKKIIHKKLCPLHLVSKEPYIIWLSFVVHKCKLMNSPGFFHSKFLFFSKRAKNGPKWEKILPVELHISGSIHHMILHLIFQESLFVVHLWKRKYLLLFFSVSNFWGQ